jgi:hypothetical protein
VLHLAAAERRQSRLSSWLQPTTETINTHVAFHAHRFIVRHPGTDPLRGLNVPKKAPLVFSFGDMIAMSPNQSLPGEGCEATSSPQGTRRRVVKLMPRAEMKGAPGQPWTGATASFGTKDQRRNRAGG